MPWNTSANLIKRRLNQHGFGQIVSAGLVCQQAEVLLPDQFRAVSFRSHRLHLVLPKRNLLTFRLKQGWLLQELRVYAALQQLPEIHELVLTFEHTSDNM